jgi:hypothetical protein
MKEPSVEEPSVLDYLKSRLTPWKGTSVEIPLAPPQAEGAAAYPAPFDTAAEPGAAPLPAAAAQPSPGPVDGSDSERPVFSLPWRALAALLFALVAQSALEPPGRSLLTGVLLYLLAAAWLVWANLRREWTLAPIPDSPDLLSNSPALTNRPLIGEPENAHQSSIVDRPSSFIDLPPSTVGRPSSVVYRPSSFVLSLLLALAAFLSFGGNRFTPSNLTLGILAVVLLVYSIWQPPPGGWGALSGRLHGFLDRPAWNLRLTPWFFILLAAFALAVFFRFYNLTGVPPEMVSDHAEKLLDVSDVLNGQTGIYFPRNTGREAFQMYLTAGVALVTSFGLSFISLKIGTVLCGVLTLPFIYLLGKEIGNRQVGLWAMAFAGIAYWPNLISRIALRFTLYPFFYAPALYFLVRGLQRRSWNDFIISGIFVGLGLHGYSPYRMAPIVMALGVAIYLLHRQSTGFRRQAALGLLVIALVSFYIFLPLLRYALANPDMFSYRALTRLSSLEQPVPGNPIQIFLQNLWNALTMFAWDNGEVWVISVTHRPVLDLVTAALFHLGVVLVAVRYLRRRHWFDLFTLVSIPLLMLPSILSIAFPAENPSLNRTAAALVPVFLIVGMSLEGLLSGLRLRLGAPVGKLAAWGLGIFLLTWSASQNYDLVFKQYLPVYENSSWNTSEMGHVVRAFADSVGSPETAWLVAYPYWADSRLVGINAGYPTRDLAIWPEQFQATTADPRAKLFLINPQDTADIELLRQLYPQGVLQEHTSPIPSKSFFMFFVPPNP